MLAPDEAERAENHDDALRLTRTGTMVGTPAYMSPEQVLAESVTEKTDIYSLGLLGYELLTGRLAYAVSSPPEMVAAHLRDTPIKLSTVVADIDPEFEALLEACLAKDAAARPSAESVATRLVRGASVLLEWPPPGLESMHGKLARTSWWLAGGALGLSVPLVLIASTAHDGVWHALLPPPIVIASTASIGALLFIASGVRLTRMARAARVAARAGYGLVTIAEVLLDWRSDTGALIAGAREFAALGPDERALLRRRRLLAGALLLVAALAPLIGFVIALPVAVRISAGPEFLAASTLGVGLAAWLFFAGLRAREATRLRAPRRRVVGAPPAPGAMARLAAAWGASFEQVRQGQSLGAGKMGGRRWRLAAVAAIGGVVIALAVIEYTLTAVAEVGEAQFASVTPDYSATEERAAIVARVRGLRGPVDSSITPRVAGAALRSIGDFNGDWHWVDKTPLFGAGTSTPWFEDAILAAPRGFTIAQRALLESMAFNPLAADFATLARAPSVDYQAAIWGARMPDSVTVGSIPVVRFVNLKPSAYAELAHAALELADGHADRAEARVRAVIGAGFGLMGSRTMLEALYGVVIVGIGRNGLARVYEATGRGQEARALTNTVLEARADFMPQRLNASDPSERLRAMRAKMRDPRTMPAIRWELAEFGLSYQPCGDLHQLLFGADTAHTAAYDEARRTLVKTPTDSMVFDLGARALERPIALPPALRRPVDGVLNGLARSIDVMLGGRRVEACVSLLSWVKAASR